MKLPIYQIDAFAKVPFEGNPAAVCPLESWLSDELMQKLAMENNLSETVFFVPEGNAYNIRWFTPECEVELCGHATLASAYVLWQFLGYQDERILFNSLSGPLSVVRAGDKLELDFPSRPVTQQIEDQELLEALGCRQARWIGKDGERVLVDLGDEQAVHNLNPDFRAMTQLPYRMFHVTAPSRDYDFICRMFAPAKGINEDPVTGSAYTALGPYWAERLGKSELFARQVSKRGGDVWVTVRGDRVGIAGYAVCTLTGEMLLPPTSPTL